MPHKKLEGHTACKYFLKQIFLIRLFFDLAIQDLSILPNGVVLSCSFDKQVIVWNYLTEKMIGSHEKSEELRCMDFIDTRKQKKLYVGTDKGIILLIDIT
jgi:WD40 repeat protein